MTSVTTTDIARDDDFEVRADHVDDDVLRNGTVTGDWFEDVHNALLTKSLVLLVGPRGCGKTHMMRYTWLRCVESPDLPFAVYVSFNRYLRLEPLLKARSDATSLFTTWVLARIGLGVIETLQRLGQQDIEPICDTIGLSIHSLQTLTQRLERGLDLSLDEEEDARSLSIDGILAAVRAAASVSGRKRSILLLDDAALTLTPEYLVEFFDVVRAVKKPDVSPKCSVYPGSTEYGPRFHATHEGRIVPAWLSVQHPNYIDIMGQIGELRYAEGSVHVPQEMRVALMYTAFGVPRAYLTLLRNVAGETTNSAAAFNKVVRDHRDAKLSEYGSLERKLPRFETLVRTGRAFFNAAVDAVRQANAASSAKNETQLLLGIESGDFDPLTTRMVSLLIEVGLFYEHQEVSHGEDRQYRRFTPHLAALIAVRAFSVGSRSSSPAVVLEALGRRASKHPVRRKLNTLLQSSVINDLKLDLPPCQNCNTARVSEQQRFCMHCGAQLSNPSTFSALMMDPIEEVPDLSVWKKERLKEHGIATIGNLLAHQDPGTELRKIHRVGMKRAEQILTAVEAYVDEYLS